eukprot:4554795-Prymnesium_polylepis.2
MQFAWSVGKGHAKRFVCPGMGVSEARLHVVMLWLSCSNSIGMEPLSRFVSSRRDPARFVSWPSCEGRVPDTRLVWITSLSSAVVRRPSCVGKVPSNEPFWSHNSVSAVRKPSSDGTVPLSELLPKKRVESAVSMPSSDGTSPPRELAARPTFVSAVSIPISDGTRPLSELVFAQISVSAKREPCQHGEHTDLCRYRAGQGILAQDQVCDAPAAAGHAVPLRHGARVVAAQPVRLVGPASTGHRLV